MIFKCFLKRSRNYYAGVVGGPTGGTAGKGGSAPPISNNDLSLSSGGLDAWGAECRARQGQARRQQHGAALLEGTSTQIQFQVNVGPSQGTSTGYLILRSTMGKDRKEGLHNTTPAAIYSIL